MARSAMPPMSVAANQATGSVDQTPQPAETAKPASEGAPPSGKPAADPKASPSPADANVDASELVKRRIELCRRRPEVCVEQGEKRDKEGAGERDDPSKNN